MASASIQLGGTLDIASGAELNAMGTRLEDKIGSLLRRDPKPIYRTIASNAIQTDATGAPVYLLLGGPPSGKVWYVRQLLAVYGDEFTTGLTVAQAGIAAAGATLTLPRGAGIQNITVISTPAGAAVSTTALQVTGAIGGPIDLSYTFQTTDSGQQYILNLDPGTPNTALAVTMPAVVGGSSYTIRALLDNPIAWYISQSEGGTPGITELMVPGTFDLPMSFLPGDSDGLFLHFGDQVVARVNGLPLGQSTMASVRVHEYIDSVEEARRM